MISEKIERTSPGSTFFQEPENLKSTERTELSEYINVLKSNKSRWATLDLSHIENLLSRTIQTMSEVRAEWLETTSRHKKGEGNIDCTVEELFVYGAVGGYLNDLLKSISSLKKTGKAPFPQKTISWNTLSGKRIRPNSFLDKMLLPGISVDVLFKTGANENDIIQNQATRYSTPDADGATCLVLAAGNVGHLLGVDVLTQLFVERRVVLCKVNPVNEYLGPIYEKGFAPLIEEGLLRIAYGGSETGKWLTTHADIDKIHMTGSKATYEAIVFGTDGDAQKRIEQNTPLNNKPITAELGNVSPVIVIPGNWNDKMIKSQAEQLAAWTTLVAGYGCLTPRVLLTHKEWPLRDRFLKELDKALRAVPPRFLYYPGTNERIKKAKAVSGDKFVSINNEETGEFACGHIYNLDLEKDDELHFKHENFCPILSEIPVSANTVEEYCEKSTAIANTQLWGSLNAYILIDSKAEKKYKKEFAQMVSDLDYGTILINMYAGFAHILHTAPWGGAPGRHPNKIDSGIGWTNDPYMFGNPQKSVFKAPFMKMYEPLLQTAKNRIAFCHSLADYQFKPTVWNGLKLFGLVGKSM
jgi:hypothetical protein